MPSHPFAKFLVWALAGPGHPVGRQLHEGDEVAGFTVLDTPGHSAGHMSLWRESDRTLICGDVFTNINTLTGLPGLHEPKAYFTPDPARNRESMRRLAELEPELVCFGHGRPLRDPRSSARSPTKWRVADAACCGAVILSPCQPGRGPGSCETASSILSFR